MAINIRQLASETSQHCLTALPFKKTKRTQNKTSAAASSLNLPSTHSLVPGQQYDLVLKSFLKTIKALNTSITIN